MADGTTDQGIASNAPGTPAPTPAPQPQVPPASTVGTPAPLPPQNGSLGTDIAKILQDIKLPERREVPGQEKPKGIENKASVFDTALGAAGAQDAATEKPLQPSVTPSNAPTPPDIVAPVHTLKQDLQHVVHDEKISVVRAVALEQDRQARRERPQAVVLQRSHRTGTIFFAVFLLLFLAAAALLGTYIITQQRSASPPPVPQQSSLLFSESAAQLPLSGKSPEDLKSALGAAKNSPQGTLGSITRVIPTVTDSTGALREATFAEFMQALGTHIPDDLVRALGSNFFFGFHTVDTNAPVFVIPVTSYDHAFAGMLEWEGTIDADLAPLFTNVSMQTTDASGLPAGRTFQDLVMRNYDVRALEDNAGNIVLYYSFPTQNLLVIAASPYTFTEVLSRLQAAREL